MSQRTVLNDLETAAGAVFIDDAGWSMPAHYGDPVTEYRLARSRAALFDVTHRGKIEVAGREAASFLHNLCTNDIKNLAVGSGCEAFFTTVKAKIIAFAYVFRAEAERYWLDVAPGVNEKAFTHLDRHLISEQVELADRTRDFVQLHLVGPDAETIRQQELLADSPAYQLRPHDAVGLPGYDLLCSAEHAVNMWQIMTEAGARPAGLETYHILRVEAGIPYDGIDFDDERFVVETGRMQALCYTKGCYLGQEPIVMARDRGHVNRAFVGLKLSGGQPLPPGTKLFREGREVGVTTSSVLSPTHGAIALAYLRVGNQQAGTVVEFSAAGAGETAEVVGLRFSGSGTGL